MAAILYRPQWVNYAIEFNVVYFANVSVINYFHEVSYYA